MMKLCGHTMGTPGYDVFESADLFAELGLQGMRSAAPSTVISA